MNRTFRGLLVAVAGIVALGVCWLGKQLLEALLSDAMRRSVDQTGETGWAVLFLVVGLFLLVGEPLVMKRANARRVMEGKGPRYGIVEFCVVLVGGIGFSLSGVAELLGWW